MDETREGPRWVAGLAAQGMSAHWSSADHCWVRFKRVAHLRYPTNDLAPLGAKERRELLWGRRMAVLQYHEPALAEAPNASLYLCDQRHYGLDVLSANNRSKVRRGLRRFEVRQSSACEIIAAGYPSYLDTHQRHGSDAMTPEQFRINWERQLDVVDREIWAAWSGAEIAAFGTVHRCGRWASISATVSSRAFLRDYPNHALFFSMIEHLMGDAAVESVSYGLSSLRTETSRESLHRFKVSIGLVAVPVVRKVVVHPLLRPAVNRGSLGAAGAVSSLAPATRIPRAARAALEFLLSPADGMEGSAGRETGTRAGPVAAPGADAASPASASGPR